MGSSTPPLDLIYLLRPASFTGHFPPAPKRVLSPASGLQGILGVSRNHKAKDEDSVFEGPKQEHPSRATPANESEASLVPRTHQDTFPHSEEERPGED